MSSLEYGKDFSVSAAHPYPKIYRVPPPFLPGHAVLHFRSHIACSRLSVVGDERKRARKKRGRTQARGGGKACKTFFTPSSGIAGAAIPSDWSILSPETWLSSSWRMELRDGKL